MTPNAQLADALDDLAWRHINWLHHNQHLLGLFSADERIATAANAIAVARFVREREAQS